MKAVECDACGRRSLAKLSECPYCHEPLRGRRVRKPRNQSADTQAPAPPVVPASDGSDATQNPLKQPVTWPTLAMSVVVVAGMLWLAFWITAPTQVPAPAYSVASEQIISEYRDNELAAHAKYRGKQVRVSGAFSESGFSLGVPWVLLDVKPAGLASLKGIQCHFGRDDASRLANLKRGQALEVQGKVVEKAIFVQLVGCVLR